MQIHLKYCVSYLFLKKMSSVVSMLLSGTACLSVFTPVIHISLGVTQQNNYIYISMARKITISNIPITYICCMEFFDALHYLIYDTKLPYNKKATTEWKRSIRITSLLLVLLQYTYTYNQPDAIDKLCYSTTVHKTYSLYNTVSSHYWFLPNQIHQTINILLSDKWQQTLDWNSSEHSGQTYSSSFTWIVRCCLKLAKREKLLPHSGHVRLLSSCIATCKRRFSGRLYVCEQCVQRYGLSSSWIFMWVLYFLNLSNSMPHKSHVWTPYRTNTWTSTTRREQKQKQKVYNFIVDTVHRGSQWWDCPTQCVWYTVNNRLTLAHRIFYQ